MEKKNVAVLAFCLELEPAECPQLLLKGILRDTGSANGRTNITVSAHVLRWGDSGIPLVLECVAVSTYRTLRILNGPTF